MAKKQMAWKTKGMNRDLSVSAFNPEFAFENRNLRLSTNDGNTLLSWVNEKGTEELGTQSDCAFWTNGEGIISYEAPSPSTGWTLHNAGDAIYIDGYPIGTAVLNHKLVVFTTNTQGSLIVSNSDRIYVFAYNSSRSALMGKILYKGDLNFNRNNPLETLVSYESEDVQKVYWVDGRNQPRVINISADNAIIDKWNVTYPSYHCFFDFIPELQLSETVTVQKLLGVSGMFAPGVIQYAFTYYNKNGQESNIFYTTPLYYISHRDRGASPEDKVENAFKITVSNVDLHFDFLRIYSIQRTSINGTPICKRIQDIRLINLTGNTASYTDIGTSGDSVDPTELLYKGGEVFHASTIEQKDGTLFFGDIEVLRKDESEIIDNLRLLSFTKNATRSIYPRVISEGNYYYTNQLTAYSDSNGTISVPCAGFKRGDIYRCGVQLQDKYGKWSKPIWYEGNGSEDSSWDKQVLGKPEEVYSTGIPTGEIDIPVIKASISESAADDLVDLGYTKIRPVVVFPNPIDRVVVCQGAVCPTMYRMNSYNAGEGAQSSWFFRVNVGSDKVDSNDKSVAPCGTIMSPSSAETIPYTSRIVGTGNGVQGYNPQSSSNNIRQVEIWGQYEGGNKFKIGDEYLTLHSPDIEFDDTLQHVGFNNTYYKKVGDSTVLRTLSDIDIQTETPTISNSGSGFVHRSFTKSHMYGIVSGLFYSDFPVDDDSDKTFRLQRLEYSPCMWMVHTWHKSGSLNNDVNRPTDKGTASAILKKKKISNLRYFKTDYDAIASWTGTPLSIAPQLFSSDELKFLKFNDKFYKGNIDTVLVPDNTDGMYFAFANTDGAGGGEPTLKETTVNTVFTDDVTWKTFATSALENNDTEGYWKLKGNTGSEYWERGNNGTGPGEEYLDLVLKKDPVRIKYKSSPHLVLKRSSDSSWSDFGFNTAYKAPILDILNPTNNSRFGGTSSDALRENIWIPCGEPVRLDNFTNIGTEQNPNLVVQFEYSYGDTYFQRWDCLKTYAFTPEDINQVVEIGSFMLETHTNIDGRYDRNRGQQNNLNMSPRNFNLLNPVYSQIDNFFSYKIMPDDYYKNDKFPNQITWSKTKESGADVDMWTNMTLASMLELDGDKGSITKLVRLNNFLFCFQDTGISQILYNDNIQVQSTQGVPIEIANSGKVNGKDYKSDTIGCSNKWSMVTTPNGIYFMDSNDKSIYLFNGQLNNLSAANGFNTWCKQNIPAGSLEWTPAFPTYGDLSQFRAFYDKLNQDVLFVNKDIAIAWSEKLQTFTSFYNYGESPFFCNLDDTGIWLRNPYTYVDDEEQTITVPTRLWKHQAGNYGSFFGVNKPYWMTLIGNPEPQLDKIFTNLEFRACVEGDGIPKPNNKFEPFLPFDSLEAWDEYQHGFTPLENKYGHSQFMHFMEDSSSLKRKFRIWRCDIPRDNACAQNMIPDYPEPPIDPTPEEEAEYEAQVAAAEASFKGMETSKGIFRQKKHPVDRLRNPWVYITLLKNAAIEENTQHKAEIHDLLMTYYS